MLYSYRKSFFIGRKGRKEAREAGKRGREEGKGSKEGAKGRREGADPYPPGGGLIFKGSSV